jgi:hypothetical protein
MWLPGDTINVATWLVGSDPEIVYFNYFFTIVVVFGLIGWGIGLLAKIISRS